MRRRSQDDLILGCVAFGLLLALVAFLKVLLSPMVATFVAGLGIGALGVFVLVSPSRRGPGHDPSSH
jgi:sensor histidine kinase regulating citrate/malate metabolism